MDGGVFILAVDSNRNNLELLIQPLQNEGFEIFTATDLEEFEQALTKTIRIQLVLLDISGFNRQVWHSCQQLRDRKIPFIVFLPRKNRKIYLEAIAHGARRVEVKPIIIKDLLIQIHNILSEQT